MSHSEGVAGGRGAVAVASRSLLLNTHASLAEGYRHIPDCVVDAIHHGLISVANGRVGGGGIDKWLMRLRRVAM